MLTMPQHYILHILRVSRTNLDVEARSCLVQCSMANHPHILPRLMSFPVARQRHAATGYQSRGAIMKQSKFKNQPTRDDLAAAWKVIRDQERIIRLLIEKTRHQDRAMGNLLMAYPRLEELGIN
jgi:hypothetical protein